MDAEHPTEARAEIGPDLDTRQKGLDGPFERWEGDHTALVHILWHAKHHGLTLEDDFDQIARLIQRSRWAAAHDAFVAENARREELSTLEAFVATSELPAIAEARRVLDAYIAERRASLG